jgi:transcriptional regulator with XRE-family HTH domain
MKSKKQRSGDSPYLELARYLVTALAKFPHLSQVELAKELGIGESIISECLSGKKKLSAPKLGSLCAKLDLDLNYAAQLADYEDEITHAKLRYSYQQALDPYVDLNGFLAAAQREMNSAELLRSLGWVQNAADTHETWIALLEQRLGREELKQTREAKANRRQIASVLVDAYIYHIGTTNGLSVPETVVEKAYQDYKRIRQLAVFLNSDWARAQAYSLLGDAYYVAKDRNALVHSLRLLEESVAIFEEQRFDPVVLRTSMLSSAYLGKRDQFLKMEQNTLDYMEAGFVSGSENVISLYEAMGRGRGVLKLTGAHQRLDAAEKEYHAAVENAHPFKWVQLCRSRLVVLTEMNSYDRDWALHLIKESIALSKKYHYTRRIRQFLAFAAQFHFSEAEVG